MKKLSIIIPVYNEEKTINQLLAKVCSVKLINNIEKEIIVVDDCSTDNSGELIRGFIEKKSEVDINYILKEENSGKGASLHLGIRVAKGDYLIIQDADLEYDPEEYNELLKPIVNGHADVVFGSRFMGGNPHRILFFWHSLGNKMLTFFSNMFTNLNLTDMETCYKMFRTEIIKSLDLKEKKFGFEPEVTAKVSRVPDVRIYEIGISYYGRKYSDGKKISWKDGLRALYSVVKYNVWARGER
ncbi:MAG: glycosyltransferase family 2 protein [Bacteroidota bacterium]|nr:glycosyltransferase family 2 protein [Bacteroidota bacterium]